MDAPLLSAILPMSDRVAERLNIERAYLLLSSLQTFWEDERPLDIFVVMPDDEQEAIETALAPFNQQPNLNIFFLNETAVSPSIANAPKGYGIAKHMLIKLAAKRFVNSKFYLILDSDVVACKLISTDKLVPNGKALTYYYPPGPPDWWHGSEKILNLPADSFISGKNRMFVTPEILSCDITSKLQAELEISFGCDWIAGLIERFDPSSPEFWTEYTLYDLFAVQHDLFDSYHVTETEVATPLHCMEQSLWVAQHLESWAPVKAFNGQSVGYFLVLQSIMAHDIDFESMRSRVIAAAHQAGIDFPDVEFIRS